MNLATYIEKVTNNFGSISEERKETFTPIINFIQERVNAQKEVHLNYICTHNSRRSQFSQIWGHIGSHYYQVPNVYSYSGGVEVTAFNERAVNTIKEIGISVSAEENGTNPIYILDFGYEGIPSTKAFSKLFDDESTASSDVGALMTCNHADENCPFIPTASARIPFRFEDPKAFDNTPQEAEKYAERSFQIATEIFYIFSQIKK
ncbi:MAG: protein-tyrosine-phosphatase [Cytophagales bacterium]|nr:protein-tyrosine-phosphatase [Cytophagales bacterium]